MFLLRFVTKRDKVPAGFGMEYGKAAMDANVLLIDDDQQLCAMLLEYLGDFGYAVTSVQRGDHGLEAALDGAYDLVLVDVMLPGMDGFEVVRRLRAASPVPILLLTARGEDVDRIVGLELGADDYLPKPFNVRELVARIRAILRRQRPPEATNTGVLSMDALRIDTQERRVRFGAEPIALTDVEYRILELLMQHAGRAISREDLARRTHGRSLRPFDRSLDMHVSRLRRKLESAGLQPDRLRTIRGEGYALMGLSAGEVA